MGDRGHRFEDKMEFPIVVESKAEVIEKTQDVVRFLGNLGLSLELMRIKIGKKVRPGKGKGRGRKYKVPVGPLIVVGDRECPLSKAGRNILGTTVISVRELSTEMLAPGTYPGRLTIWTEDAIKSLGERFG